MCSVIAELLPDYVRLACMRVQDAALDVLEAERPLIKKAVEKRRREFSAGRYLRPAGSPGAWLRGRADRT